MKRLSLCVVLGALVLALSAPALLATPRGGGFSGHRMPPGRFTQWGPQGGFPGQAPVVMPAPVPWGFPAPAPEPLTFPVAPVYPPVTAPAPADAAVGDTDDPPPQLVKYIGRYLRLKNDTGGKLTVYLQYRWGNSKTPLNWYPADPRTSTEALTFVLQRGQETKLADGDWTINASRVRVWAVADSGEEWGEYRDRDLWLVPEVDAAVRHYYTAPGMETFSHQFGR